MTNLKDAALKAKGELWQLECIDLTKAEVKEDVFNKDENGQIKAIKYNYVEIDGKKYSIKTKVLNKIKEMLEERPMITKIRLKKTNSGDLIVIPLD